MVQVLEGCPEVGRRLVAVPAQLSNVLVEQVDGVLKPCPFNSLEIIN